MSDNKNKHITGMITGVKYDIILPENLKTINIEELDVNTMPSSCIISNNWTTFTLSKWVSPKRTRSYPYERVYNTLWHLSKKITIIPIVKDEWIDWDRDFLQWDTVSLMSLLDVYVIFAYYSSAKKSWEKEKITNQKFDNKYILQKINEIWSYHSSALHWNLEELNKNLPTIIETVKGFYTDIENTTGVKLHPFKWLDNFKEKIGVDVGEFMKYSRDKAEQAQHREFITLQPKESLDTETKAKITITNYLWWKYYFTVDEIYIEDWVIKLIEWKHSGNSKLPSKWDIKDWLLKMILYSNLSNVKIDWEDYISEAILSLTSPLIVWTINSKQTNQELWVFITNNGFNKKQEQEITKLFDEARNNNFVILIKKIC